MMYDICNFTFLQFYTGYRYYHIELRKRDLVAFEAYETHFYELQCLASSHSII